jgi:hypothetical protein
MPGFSANLSTVFIDHPEYYKKMWEEENSETVEQTKEQLTRATTAEDKLAFQKKLNQNMPVEISDIRLWTEDISFIIDELERMNLASELFQGRLDLKRVGGMGFSKGGAAAGQACLTEKRCKAGINLGGFMFGDIGEKKLAVPFMVIESVENWCKDCVPINDLLFHVLQFFNRHLKGLPAPLLDGPPTDYPEVRFKSRHSI